MVDALALGASGGNPMEVQVLSPAQFDNKKGVNFIDTRPSNGYN